MWDVAAAPLGQYFASASADRTARVWVTERAQSLRLLSGHHSDVSTVVWHPNGDLVASASDDRTIRLWDVRDGRPRRILVGHGCGVSSRPQKWAGGSIMHALRGGCAEWGWSGNSSWGIISVLPIPAAIAMFEAACWPGSL